MYYNIDLSHENEFPILHNLMDTLKGMPKDIHSVLFDVIYDHNAWASWKAGWHITVFFGKEPSAEMQKFLSESVGKDFKFIMEAIGYTEGAMAIKVRPLDDSFVTNSKFPHITVGLKLGHKPVESNQITNWYEFAFSRPYILEGKLQKVHD